MEVKHVRQTLTTGAPKLINSDLFLEKRAPKLINSDLFQHVFPDPFANFLQLYLSNQTIMKFFTNSLEDFPPYCVICNICDIFVKSDMSGLKIQYNTIQYKFIWHKKLQETFSTNR